MIKELYSVKELSKTFSVCERTIRRWHDEGLFPNTIRIKLKLLFTASDVQRLFDSRRIQPAAPSAGRRIISSGIQ